jgi:hypothetical protein
MKRKAMAQRAPIKAWFRDRMIPIRANIVGPPSVATRILELLRVVYFLTG